MPSAFWISVFWFVVGQQQQQQQQQYTEKPNR